MFIGVFLTSLFLQTQGQILNGLWDLKAYLEPTETYSTSSKAYLKPSAAYLKQVSWLQPQRTNNGNFFDRLSTNSPVINGETYNKLNRIVKDKIAALGQFFNIENLAAPNHFNKKENINNENEFAKNLRFKIGNYFNKNENLKLKERFNENFRFKNEFSDNSRYTNEFSDNSRFKNELSDNLRYKNEFSDNLRYKNEFSDILRFKNEFSDNLRFKNEFTDILRFKNEFSNNSRFHDSDLKQIKKIQPNFRIIDQKVPNNPKTRFGNYFQTYFQPKTRYVNSFQPPMETRKIYFQHPAYQKLAPVSKHQGHQNSFIRESLKMPLLPKMKKLVKRKEFVKTYCTFSKNNKKIKVDIAIPAKELYSNPSVLRILKSLTKPDQCEKVAAAEILRLKKMNEEVPNFLFENENGNFIEQINVQAELKNRQKNVDSARKNFDNDYNKPITNLNGDISNEKQSDDKILLKEKNNSAEQYNNKGIENVNSKDHDKILKNQSNSETRRKLPSIPAKSNRHPKFLRTNDVIDPEPNFLSFGPGSEIQSDDLLEKVITENSRLLQKRLLFRGDVKNSKLQDIKNKNVKNFKVTDVKNKSGKNSKLTDVKNKIAKNFNVRNPKLPQLTRNSENPTDITSLLRPEETEAPVEDSDEMTAEDSEETDMEDRVAEFGLPSIIPEVNNIFVESLLYPSGTTNNNNQPWAAPWGLSDIWRNADLFSLTWPPAFKPVIDNVDDSIDLLNFGSLGQSFTQDLRVSEPIFQPNSFAPQSNFQLNSLLPQSQPFSQSPDGIVVEPAGVSSFVDFSRVENAGSTSFQTFDLQKRLGRAIATPKPKFRENPTEQQYQNFETAQVSHKRTRNPKFLFSDSTDLGRKILNLFGVPGVTVNLDTDIPSQGQKYIFLPQTLTSLNFGLAIPEALNSWIQIEPKLTFSLIE